MSLERLWEILGLKPGALAIVSGSQPGGHYPPRVGKIESEPSKYSTTALQWGLLPGKFAWDCSHSLNPFPLKGFQLLEGNNNYKEVRLGFLWGFLLIQFFWVFGSRENPKVMGTMTCGSSIRS